MFPEITMLLKACYPVDERELCLLVKGSDQMMGLDHGSRVADTRYFYDQLRCCRNFERLC